MKGIQGAEGIYKPKWASDGRGTFQYGRPSAGTEPHIVWRCIGTHEVLDRP